MCTKNIHTKPVGPASPWTLFIKRPNNGGTECTDFPQSIKGSLVACVWHTKGVKEPQEVGREEGVFCWAVPSAPSEEPGQARLSSSIWSCAPRPTATLTVRADLLVPTWPRSE